MVFLKFNKNSLKGFTLYSFFSPSMPIIGAWEWPGALKVPPTNMEGKEDHIINSISDLSFIRRSPIYGEHTSDSSSWCLSSRGDNLIHHTFICSKEGVGIFFFTWNTVFNIEVFQTRTVSVMFFTQVIHLLF